MGPLTQEEVNEAIKNVIKICKWRKSVKGTDICCGNCSICLREIKAGRCDALRRLVADWEKEN